MSFRGQLNVKAGIDSDGEDVYIHSGCLKIKGSTTSGVTTLLKDGDGMILMATGTTVPGDVAGYAKGCLFIDTDVADGTTGLYVNVGTTTSADFDAVSDA